MCQNTGLSLIRIFPGMEFRDSPSISLDSVIILENMDQRKQMLVELDLHSKFFYLKEDTFGVSDDDGNNA